MVYEAGSLAWILHLTAVALAHNSVFQKTYLRVYILLQFFSQSHMLLA